MVNYNSYQKKKDPKLVQGIYDFLKSAFAGFLLILVSRVTEFLLLKPFHSIENPFKWVISVVSYDLLFSLQLSMALMIVFLSLYLLKPFMAKFFHFLILVLLLLLNAFLVNQYQQTGKPVGSEFLMHAPSELLQNFLLFVNSSRQILILIICNVVIAIITCLLIYRIRIRESFAAFILIVVVFSVLFAYKLNPSESNFISKEKYGLVVNKTQHLTFDIIANLTKK
jgi:hypothetical protein